MGSDIRHVRGEAQKELVKKFEVFTSKGRSRWQVWSDWITISAIAVSNATDKSHFDEREQQYMTIVKKYTKQEVDAFADMFSILVMALEDNLEQDFLGCICAWGLEVTTRASSSRLTTFASLCLR